ncbi:PREDICTED: galactosylceramide sulfotransferase-like [Branchiostoma belcheri]|uniref:Galactosylceramide sulfotransferase-like n=1 Tax=Branchiostoma belcheri TaxID=7741 RepID=A0A6P4YQC1_BRABE|nr:PREDICTED: galactosylceramide sulfotransferase-like [Branchiostoma belcheri]
MSALRRHISVHVDSKSVRGGGNSKEQYSMFSRTAAAVLGVLLGAILTYVSLYVDLGGFQIAAESQAYSLPRGVTVNGSAAAIAAESYKVLSNWSLTETPPAPPHGLCSAERKHFAFVKVHKAGSTTPYTVFQRFGRKRHLQFVLPSNERVDVGWPYLMKKEDYLQPIPGRPFDLLVDHTVYNREIFRNLLPNDTVYLAIVREPYSHLKSVVNWYSVVRKYGLQKTDPVDDLLKHPGELDRKWLVPREHKQPFSYTRNFMSYDLGLPIALADDETYVRDYIAQLDRDFLLVLVLEYFDESLVLLKRYMCWQLTDIFYKIQNSREYGFKEEDLSPKMKKIHRNWSRADYLIYEHFNRTLWDKITHEGEDFFNELARFKEINQMTSRFCDVTVVKNSTADKRFGASRWNDEFVIDGKFCGVLNTRHLLSLKRMHVEELRNKGVNMPWPKWLGPPPKKPADKKQPQPQSKPAEKQKPKPPVKRTVTVKRIKSSKKRRH